MASSIEALKCVWAKDNAHLKTTAAWRQPWAVMPEDVRSGRAIDFCSNDYLGAKNRALPAAAKGVKTGRTRTDRLEQCDQTLPCARGAGASRLVVEFDPALAKLEAAFAALTGWRTGVYVNSGFMANLALFDALQTDGLEVFVDHRAHASLHAAGRMSSGLKVTLFRHFDYPHLEKKLAASTATHKVIAVEALHSMDGTFENAARLAEVCQESGAVCVIDEAHTAGLMGELGAGWLSVHSVLAPHVVAVMFGAAKALGVAGGFIACDEELRNRIFQKSRAVIYTTAPSPLVTEAVLESISWIQGAEGAAARVSLSRNVCLFRNLIAAHTTLTTSEPKPGQVLAEAGSPIFSWILGSEELALSWAQALCAQGFLVRAIRPPTVPRGTSRLRIIVRASHTEAQLVRLMECLRALPAGVK